MMVVHLEWLTPYQGWMALGREQFESNHHKNQATGKEGEADDRCHKNNPQKRRNRSMPVGYLGWVAVRREQCGM
jgi:hypothetical protein